MELQYINPKGEQKSVAGAAELAKAIKLGEITSQTMVRTSAEQKWTPASIHPECLAFSGGDASLMTAQDIRNVATLRRNGRLAWCSAPVIVLVGGGLGGVSAYNIGTLFGGTLLWAAIILVIVALLRRKRSPLDQARIATKAGFWFAAITTLSVSGFIVEAKEQRSEAKQISQTMDQYVDYAEKNVAATTTAEEATPRSPPASTASETPAGGSDMSKVRVMLKDVLARTTLMQDKYNQAYTSSGLDSALEPSVLVSAEGRRRARTALATINAALTEYEAELAAHYKDAVSLPDKYNLSAANADDAKRGFAVGMKKSKPKAEQILRLERDMLELIVEIVTFVEARPVTPQVSDGNLMFAYEYEADEYNRLFEELSARANEQSKIQVSMLQSMQEDAKNVKALAEAM